MKRMRVLLSEGSSLSARQTLYALARGGHHVEICDPNPTFCLARFSRLVRAVHRCPSFTADPSGYLSFLRERLAVGRFDVLFPTHDQVYLLSHCRDELAQLVALPVPNFDALERLQSKAEMVRLLERLGVPCPPTQLVRSRAELESCHDFPFYVKLSFSTAGRGVRRVRDAAERSRIADELERDGRFDGQSELLIQSAAEGTLGVVQTVFRRGTLEAGHCYLAREQGVGGSAWARVGVRQPVVLDHVARIGSHLGWHGALMFDYIWDEEAKRPSFIDANPRIGETFNAALSGVNLCEALLDVAVDRRTESSPEPRSGVRTHSLMMSLMAVGEAGGTRRQLLGELRRAWMRRGPYAGGEDEITRPGADILSLIPLAYLTARLMISPRAAAATVGRTVDRYSLNEDAARRIRALRS